MNKLIFILNNFYSYKEISITCILNLNSCVWTQSGLSHSFLNAKKVFSLLAAMFYFLSDQITSAVIYNFIYESTTYINILIHRPIYLNTLYVFN